MTDFTESVKLLTAMVSLLTALVGLSKALKQGSKPKKKGSVRPKLTYSIFPIWDDNAREQFEFAPGH